MRRALVGISVTLCAGSLRAAPPSAISEAELTAVSRDVLAVNLPAPTNVELPDLESGRDGAIVKDNVLAVSAIYYAWQLEQLKLFAVVDRVAQRFTPVKASADGGAASSRWRTFDSSRARWLSEANRRALYANVFGGNPSPVDDVAPNREFPELWNRFVAAIGELERLGSALTAGAAAPEVEQARRAARDLAVNLSRHGRGAARQAATLRDQVRDALSILSQPDVLSAYGAYDAWAVIERVSADSLGGAPNTVQARSLAATGASLLIWLANGGALGGEQFKASLAGQPSVRAHARAWLVASGFPEADAVDREPRATQLATSASASASTTAAPPPPPKPQVTRSPAPTHRGPLR